MELALPTKPLRLLIFMHCSELGGAERTTLARVRQLREYHDVAVTVVLPHDGPLQQELSACGARAIILDAGWWCEFDRTRLVGSATTLQRALHERAEEFATDVVMSVSLTIPWGALAASLLRVPHLWSLHETGAYLPFVLPMEQIVGVIDEASNAVIVVSQAVRRAVAAIGDEKVSVVHPYIPEIEPPAGERARPEWPRPRVIVAGTKAAQKGQEDAIKAVAVLGARGRAVDVAVIGPAPAAEDARLIALAEELGVSERVHIDGFRADVHDLIASADLVVDPTRNGGWGRVIVEAMQVGTPIVATRSGGAVELCQDGTYGVEYTPGDATDLARAIELVLDDAAETAARVHRAREFARDMSQRDRRGDEIFQRLQSLVGEPNPTPPAWSRLFLELIRTAASSTDAALAEAARAQAAHAAVAVEAEESRAAQRALMADWETAIAERDQLAADLEHLTTERNRITSEYEASATSRDQLVLAHQQLQVDYEQRVVALAETARRLRAHIAATEATVGFRALRQLSRGRDALLPPGTRRRRFYSWIGRAFGQG